MDRKRQNFVRLVEQRVNRTLKEIRLIGNLSNRSAYSWTEDDVKKVFRALQKEVDTAKARFGEGENGGETPFKL